MEKSYKELCGEIEELKKLAAAARTQEIAKAKDEVRRLIQEFNLSPVDCGFLPAKDKKSLPVKYRHPDNPSLVWTGRGKAPKWIVAEERNGLRRERFLVK